MEQISKKRYFRSKAEKMNITTEFFIFKSAQADNFDLLDQICPKGVFLV